MQFVGMLRNQQNKNHAHGLTIWRLKRDFRRQAQKRCKSVSYSFHASMGQGKTMTQPRGAQLFTIEQSVEDLTAR